MIANEYPISASRGAALAVWRAWLSTYSAIWAMTLTAASVVALLGGSASTATEHLLGARLDPWLTPAPGIGRVLALFAQNLPLCSWPLLLGVAGAHRARFTRLIADVVVAAWVTVNVVMVGAALGAYGEPLLAYLPQLPVEWSALALGPSTWLIQRRRALTPRQGLRLFALIGACVLCAAVLETVAVPHR